MAIATALFSLVKRHDLTLLLSGQALLSQSQSASLPCKEICAKLSLVTLDKSPVKGSSSSIGTALTSYAFHRPSKFAALARGCVDKSTLLSSGLLTSVGTQLSFAQLSAKPCQASFQRTSLSTSTSSSDSSSADRQMYCTKRYLFSKLAIFRLKADGPMHGSTKCLQLRGIALTGHIHEIWLLSTALAFRHCSMLGCGCSFMPKNFSKRECQEQKTGKIDRARTLIKDCKAQVHNSACHLAQSLCTTPHQKFMHTDCQLNSKSEALIIARAGLSKRNRPPTDSVKTRRSLCSPPQAKHCSMTLTFRFPESSTPESNCAGMAASVSSSSSF